MEKIPASQIEQALLQIPDVRAARLVTDTSGKPVEVHIVATGEKSPKQLVRDVQTVSLATFGLDLDHRIVSVVQFPQGTNGAGNKTKDRRPSIEEITTETRGAQSRVKVTLKLGNKESTGEGHGITSAESLQRLAANATLDAIKGFLAEGSWVTIEHIAIQSAGIQDVAMATLSVGTPSGPLRLSGSAVVASQQTEAIARALLDAVNRRLWRTD